MKRRVGYVVTMVAVLGALLLWVSPGFGQEQPSGGSAKSKAQPVPKGGPAPKAADGHPDLSGVWFPGSAGGFTFNGALRKQFDPKVTPEEAAAIRN